jgi:hypothetical protein
MAGWPIPQPIELPGFYPRLVLEYFVSGWHIPTEFDFISGFTV